jgi:hypothetical protein
MVTEINPPCSPNIGEAIAARLAFQLASSLNLNRVIIEGDSQIVISGLSNPVITQDWRIHSLIINIIDSIPTGLLWKARKINRSANFCAHSVAHWAAARSFSGSIPTLSLSPSIVNGNFPSHSYFNLL